MRSVSCTNKLTWESPIKALIYREAHGDTRLCFIYSFLPSIVCNTVVITRAGSSGALQIPESLSPEGNTMCKFMTCHKAPCPIPVVAINNKWLVAWCSIVALISLLLHLRLPLFYGNIFITLIEYCFISLRYSRDIVHC